MKKTLLACIGIVCFLTLQAQWSNNPAENNQVTPDNRNGNYGYEFVTTKDGISYVMFLHPVDGNTATFLQIIDKDGNKVMPEECLMVSHKRTISWTQVNDLLWADSDGNAIIAVSDCRNSSADSNDLSYHIYKISPTGEFLWGEDGIDLEEGHSNRLKAWMKMIQLEDGSYVFAWVAIDDLYKICMQRVSQEGELLWEGVVLEDINVTYSTPFLVNGGNNQVILVYTKGTNQDLMARKIDFDGTSVWPEDVRIYRAGFGSIPLQGVITVISDNNGGAFVGWYDDRNWTNIEDVYVAHVKSNGTLGFTAEDNGLRIGYSIYRGNKPAMVYNEEGGYLYAIWREEGSGYRLVGQKISLSGELMWDPEGKEISPFLTGSVPPQVGEISIRNGLPGELAVFYMINYDYSNVGTFMQLIDTQDGNPIWEDVTIPITTVESYKGGLTSTPLINDTHWLLLWQDGREGGMDSKILFMQRINTDGTYGSIIQSVLPLHTDSHSLIAVPAVVEETTKFIFDNKAAGHVDISIYSLNGQKIDTAYSGYMEEGNQSVCWNLKKGIFTSGVYIVMLKTAHATESARIIIK